MKVTLFLITFVAFFGIAFSALAHYPPPPPGKEGDCWSDLTGPMKNGQEIIKIENNCARANCYDDRTLTIATCGAVSGPNGKTDYDYSKPYPECCPQPK